MRIINLEFDINRVFQCEHSRDDVEPGNPREILPRGPPWFGVSFDPVSRGRSRRIVRARPRRGPRSRASERRGIGTTGPARRRDTRSLEDGSSSAMTTNRSTAEGPARRTPEPRSWPRPPGLALLGLALFGLVQAGCRSDGCSTCSGFGSRITNGVQALGARISKHFDGCGGGSDCGCGGGWKRASSSIRRPRSSFPAAWPCPPRGPSCRPRRSSPSRPN